MLYIARLPCSKNAGNLISTMLVNFINLKYFLKKQNDIKIKF